MEYYSYKEEWYYVICRKIMKLKTIVNNNGASQAQKDQYHMLSFNYTGSWQGSRNLVT